MYYNKRNYTDECKVKCYESDIKTVDELKIQELLQKNPDSPGTEIRTWHHTYEPTTLSLETNMF